MGTIVEVVGDQRHTSAELIKAADAHRLLTFNEYFHFSSPEIRAAYPIPGRMSIKAHPGYYEGNYIFSGMLGDRQISVSSLGGNIYKAFVMLEDGKHALALTGDNLNRLKLYISLMYGEIKWEKALSD